MEILDILTNYGCIGVLVIIFWILFQEVLNENKDNRELYHKSIKEFNETVLNFNLTIKEISDEVKNTNSRIDDMKEDIEETKIDDKDIKQKIDDLSRE